jgi:hypothetical protein
MKVSPLCSRDGGRELYLTARVDARKYRLTLPAAMLDDTCGVTSGEAGRKAWVKENMPDVQATLTARISDASVRPPYTRILVEEIS